MQQYQVTQIKDPGNPGVVSMLKYLQETLTPSLGKKGMTLFGIFQGLFGLDSNELYLVTSSTRDPEDFKPELISAGFQMVENTVLYPTTRPKKQAQRTKEGVYVFRWFDVLEKNVQEIVELSAAAWITFEGGFETEVQALMSSVPPAPRQGSTDQQQTCKMLLITWYDSLSVWQASRQPPAEAQDNFLRRHALTIQAHPVATRLLLPSQT